MIDTHCHLYSDEFKYDFKAVIEIARKAGVSRFYLPAIDENTYGEMMALEDEFKGICFAMMGLHPCSVDKDLMKKLEITGNWLEKRKFIAIGETGLDFHWDKTFIPEQYNSLNKHIEWALKYQLPIVLHTRDAMQETIDVIKSHRGKGLKGIFHCFGGTVDEAKQIIEAGFLLGIGGVVTYKNSGLSEVLGAVGIDKVVLETDAPYLAPVPFRGKRNESSYLSYVAAKISEITGISVQEIDNVTTHNAINLYGDD